MMPNFLFKFLFPATFILIAGFFILIALITIFQKKPFILSARWLVAVMCLCYLPSIVNTFYMGFVIGDMSLVMWLNPLMFGILLIFFWIQMRGYMFFGISDTFFRDAILFSAQNLGFTIEETMSKLKIKETGEEMQVAIQGWIGTAQLKAAKSDSGASVSRIATEMKSYFSSAKGNMNFLTSYFYLIVGLFMIAMSIFLFMM